MVALMQFVNRETHNFVVSAKNEQERYGINVGKLATKCKNEITLFGASFLLPLPDFLCSLFCACDSSNFIIVILCPEKV